MTALQVQNLAENFIDDLKALDLGEYIQYQITILTPENVLTTRNIQQPFYPLFIALQMRDKNFSVLNDTFLDTVKEFTKMILEDEENIDIIIKGMRQAIKTWEEEKQE